MSTIRVYSKDQLTLRPAVAGARIWAVGLDQTMLTYFEMAPPPSQRGIEGNFLGDDIAVQISLFHKTA